MFKHILDDPLSQCSTEHTNNTQTFANLKMLMVVKSLFLEKKIQSQTHALFNCSVWFWDRAALWRWSHLKSRVFSEHLLIDTSFYGHYFAARDSRFCQHISGRKNSSYWLTLDFNFIENVWESINNVNRFPATFMT